LGSEIGQDPDQVRDITRAVKGTVRVPVIAKITPNAADPAALAEAAERAGADAVSAINTLRALSVNVELRRPTLSHGLGGLSGPAIKPVGLACVWQIARRVRIPVIGIGGIVSGRDALEYLMAGARAVQVGTAVAFEGIRVFGRIVRELNDLLDSLGLSRAEDAVGAARTGSLDESARAQWTAPSRTTA
jgi:dihydroorotate dehydrogenase (NAD+) catalytic subunit